MSLIINKFTPNKLDNYILNKELAIKIKKYVNNGELLNTLISGPEGCGKYTLAMNILNEYYGDGVYKKKNNFFKLKVGTNVKSLEIVYSNYHYEIFINQYLFNDKTTLLMLIKDIIESYNINTNSFNVIVIKSLGFIINSSITIFKSLMEEYYDTCRFIFICNKTNKINIIKSYIFHIKMPKLENHAIISFFKNKNINIDNQLLNNIDGNLNKLNCLLQSNKDKLIIDEYLDKFITILNVKDIKMIEKLREHLYNYICKNFNKHLIYHKILDYFIKSDKIDDTKKHKLISLSAKFQHRQVVSYREIIHIEAYLMNVFKTIHY